MSKSYFHIGYPKSGSTTLQKQFFNVHSQINFLGIYPTGNTGIDSALTDDQHPYFTLPALKQLHDQLVLDEGFDHEEQTNNLEAIISKTHTGEEINMLSNERVTSTFFAYPNIEEKLKRIKSIGFDGVIVIVRNQLDIIKSQYREHPFDPEDLVHGKPVTIDEWIVKAGHLVPSYLESLKYDEVCEICETLFGKNNMAVISFKDIFHKPHETAIKLSKTLKIDEIETLDLLSQLTTENRGVSKKYNLVRNLKKRLLGEFPISKYLPNILNNRLKSLLKKGRKETYVIKKESLIYLDGVFAESNATLLSNYQIDLGSFE